MFETDTEIEALQQLFDASLASAGPHLLSIAHDGRLLTARQVATHLAGTRHLAVSTVTQDGRPIVSMVDGHFVHARFWFATDGSELKIRHLRQRFALSAVHAVGDELALTMHGTAALVGRRAGLRRDGESLPLHLRRYAR